MERIDELKKLYEDYHTEATRVKAAASWFDGIFGFGNDPRKNPCHDAFYTAAQQWAEGFFASGPDREVALAAARWMVEAPAGHRTSEGYWYMYAAMGFLEPLIPLFTREDCAALAQRLNDLYPRAERMPLQQNLYKKLVKAGK